MTPLTPSRRSAAGLALALTLTAAACGSDDPETAPADTSDVAETDSVTTEAEELESTATDPVTTDAATATTDAPADTTATTDAIATTDATAEAADTTAGVEAAQWADNVTITMGDGTFTFESDSIPSHELPDQMLIPTGQPGDDAGGFDVVDTDELLTPVDISVDITLNPVYSETVTENSLGQIGVMISGAQLFNDFENMERTLVAVDDQTIIDGVAFLDSCNGHTLATGLDYHYHGVPYCITDDVDVADEHSTIIGVVRDGFPFYGNKDEGGVTITSADLDECSGHFGPTPEFPEGIYHYHLTDDAAPYSINCYHGVVDDSVTQPAGGGGGGGGGEGGGPPGGDDNGGGGGGGQGGGPPADGSGPPAGEAPVATDG